MPSDEVGSTAIRDAADLQAAAALISTQPMSSLPGSTFAYGALSMQAAGAAAEIATGQSFSSLLNDRILSPLAMSHTGFVVPSANSLNPRVAGGLSSTAADYGSFMDMLLNKGDARNGTHVLSAGAVTTMLTRQATDGETQQDYGIGVWLGQAGEADVLAGGARGFHSWIDIEHKLVFVFATDKTSIENVMPLTLQMHQAILQAVAVPEPQTYAMLLLGLGLIAGLAHRRLGPL
ncbi:beta-lactamase family protein [Paucibacter oligotrophus]|uniref:Beta-lactamase family protein n=1 Tax=Roseateles oligotrophus TaxID=1769250 RepID=A0ABT2YHP7_9BURK|nr:beta-lactamase family protein [Roseateles oligotrophus]